MSFAWNQLQAAIRVLAGTTDRRERLAGAYGKLIKLKPKDLPAECAADYLLLTGRIARYPVKNIGQDIRTEVQSLSDQEVAQAIQKIMAMYDAVAAYQPRPVVRSAGKPGRPAQGFARPVPAVHVLEKSLNHFAQEHAG